MLILDIAPSHPTGLFYTNIELFCILLVYHLLYLLPLDQEVISVLRIISKILTESLISKYKTPIQQLILNLKKI